MRGKAQFPWQELGKSDMIYPLVSSNMTMENLLYMEGFNGKINSLSLSLSRLITGWYIHTYIHTVHTYIARMWVLGASGLQTWFAGTSQCTDGILLLQRCFEMSPVPRSNGLGPVIYVKHFWRLLHLKHKRSGVQHLTGLSSIKSHHQLVLKPRNVTGLVPNSIPRSHAVDSP